MFNVVYIFRLFETQRKSSSKRRYVNMTMIFTVHQQASFGLQLFSGSGEQILFADTQRRLVDRSAAIEESTHAKRRHNNQYVNETKFHY
jgi:hypothetical protein